MSPSAPTLGILVTGSCQTPEFSDFLRTASREIRAGKQVYAYLLHDAVDGLRLPVLQSLRERGLVLHACAFAAFQRNIPNSESAVFSGLVTLADLILRCDQFKTFSPKEPR
jgi:hypothetical protein